MFEVLPKIEKEQEIRGKLDDIMTTGVTMGD
jgi:hypothetical protein